MPEGGVGVKMPARSGGLFNPVNFDTLPKRAFVPQDPAPPVLWPDQEPYSPPPYDINYNAVPQQPPPDAPPPPVGFYVPPQSYEFPVQDVIDTTQQVTDVPAGGPDILDMNGVPYFNQDGSVKATDNAGNVIVEADAAPTQKAASIIAEPLTDVPYDYFADSSFDANPTQTYPDAAGNPVELTDSQYQDILDTGSQAVAADIASGNKNFDDTVPTTYVDDSGATPSYFADAIYDANPTQTYTDAASGNDSLTESQYQDILSTGGDLVAADIAAGNKTFDSTVPTGYVDDAGSYQSYFNDSSDDPVLAEPAPRDPSWIDLSAANAASLGVSEPPAQSDPGFLSSASDWIQNLFSDTPTPALSYEDQLASDLQYNTGDTSFLDNPVFWQSQGGIDNFVSGPGELSSTYTDRNANMDAVNFLGGWDIGGSPTNYIDPAEVRAYQELYQGGGGMTFTEPGQTFANTNQALFDYAAANPLPVDPQVQAFNDSVAATQAADTRTPDQIAAQEAQTAEWQAQQDAYNSDPAVQAEQAAAAEAYMQDNAWMYGGQFTSGSDAPAYSAPAPEPVQAAPAPEPVYTAPAPATAPAPEIRDAIINAMAPEPAPAAAPEPAPQVEQTPVVNDEQAMQDALQEYYAQLYAMYQMGGGW